MATPFPPTLFLRGASLPSKDGAKEFTIVADNELWGGSKQRGFPYYRYLRLAHPLAETLMYTGGYNGAGAYSMAYGAKGTGFKSCAVLSQQGVGLEGVTPLAIVKSSVPYLKLKEAGSDVVVKPDWSSLVTAGKAIAKDPQVYWLPLGIDEEMYSTYLEQGIAEAYRNSGSPFNARQTIYLVGGTGVVARAVARALPCRVAVVPAASPFKLKQKLKGTRIKVLPQNQPVLGVYPVPTTMGYDSRAFDSAAACGKSGDIVWNVAGGAEIEMPEILAPSVDPAVVKEEERNSSYRSFLRYLYSNIRTDDRKAAAKMVPDFISRRLFDCYAGSKHGDPLILDESELGEVFTQALRKQLGVAVGDSDAEATMAGFSIPELVASGEIKRLPGGYSCGVLGDIPKNIVERLRTRFVGEGSFATAAVCVYLRYGALAAFGHQMAMPQAARNAVSRIFAYGKNEPVALFGSCFNEKAPKYFSMFPDVEEPFGSLGSFGDNFVERSGGEETFVANPPYDEGMLEKMVDVVLREMAKADEGGKNLTVLVGMPGWTDFAPTEILRKSSYCETEVKYENKEVKWVNTEILTGQEKTARIPAHLWFVVSTKKWDRAAVGQLKTTWKGV